jgi:hypothetical protein
VWTVIGLAIYGIYSRHHAKPPRFVLHDKPQAAE